jgi:hypothetical protein
MSSMDELIERVKSATGPNYQLECDINKLFAPERIVPPAYTASIDAVVALVREHLPGWGADVDVISYDGASCAACMFAPEFTDDVNIVTAEAHTPAPALLAAFLSARPNTAKQGEEGK